MAHPIIPGQKLSNQFLAARSLEFCTASQAPWLNCGFGRKAKCHIRPLYLTEPLSSIQPIPPGSINFKEIFWVQQNLQPHSVHTNLKEGKNSLSIWVPVLVQFLLKNFVAAKESHFEFKFFK